MIQFLLNKKINIIKLTVKSYYRSDLCCPFSSPDIKGMSQFDQEFYFNISDGSV
jgi:hypothetical protein